MLLKKTLTQLLTAALILCGFASAARAGLSIYPYSLEFDADSRKRVQSVRVINTSEKTQTYRVSFVNFRQDENGGLQEVSGENSFAADKYLNWSPRQFTLKAGEVQTVNVARRSLAQAPDGEYVSHLKIREVNLGTPPAKKRGSGGFSLSLRPLFAITIPVTLIKGKNQVAETAVESAVISGGNLKIVLKRLGNISSRVNIAVLEGKEEIGRLNSVKIYPPLEKLKQTVKLKKNATKAILKLEDAKTKEEIYRHELPL